MNIVPCIESGGNRTGGTRPPGTTVDTAGSLIAAPLGAKRDGGWRGDLDNDTYVTHVLRAEGFDASEDGTGRGIPLTLAIRGRGDSYDPEIRQDGTANALLQPNGRRAGIGVGAIAFKANMSMQEWSSSDSCGTLQADNQHAIAGGMTVRRLTPRECERLQGFPDDYTLIDYKDKPAADGPRYRAIGNSMAVPVMRWIGERIAFVDRLEESA